MSNINVKKNINLSRKNFYNKIEKDPSLKGKNNRDAAQLDIS